MAVIEARTSCAVAGCDRLGNLRGWCHLHYVRWLTHGDPLTNLREFSPERFWSRVDRSGGADACWPWLGARDTDGYAQVKTSQGRKMTHRVAYELSNGAIPEGLTLDHLCHTRDFGCGGGRGCLHRRCVNPAHLEPVTQLANVLRGRGITADNLRRDTCIHGHPYDEIDGRGHRRCSDCRRRWGREWARRNAAARRVAA